MKNERKQQKSKQKWGIKTSLIDAEAYEKYGVLIAKETATAA